MTLEKFCSEIKLNKEALKKLLEMKISEAEYSYYKKLYNENREKFFSEIEAKENFRLLLQAGNGKL